MKEPSRQIVYLVPALDHVSVRHRVDPFVAALRERDWEVRKRPIPRGIFQRLRLFWQTRGAAAVVIVRKLFPAWQLWLLRRFAARLVYDFDDAVLYRDSSRDNPFSHLRAKRFRRTVTGACLTIAGNDYLLSLAEHFGGRPQVVPTCVDDDVLTPAPAGMSGGRLVIGWIGSHSTVVYLEMLRGVFKELNTRYGPSVVLKVVCDRFPEDMGLTVERKMWAREDELEDLRSFDVGVMPLADDVWTRGKCGFKLLQYMAVGVPAVASPVGVNADIIRDGENGFLAYSEERWVGVLSELIEDLDLRRRVGAAGRESLRGRYAVRDWVDRYVALIESALGGEDARA